MRKTTFQPGIRLASILLFIVFLFTPLQANAQNQVYYQDQAVVLMYHHLDPEKKSSATITPELFKSQLEMLKKEGFNVIPIEELAAFYKEGKKLPPNAVVLTFDDGYESFYTYAYPELKSQGFVATNFVIVSQVGKKNEGIPKLDWGQMREMQLEGMSFYSHTYDSHYYTQIDAAGRQAPVLAAQRYLPELNRVETPEEYRRRIIEDMRKSRLILEQELDKPAIFLAVPFGRYGSSLSYWAKYAGFEFVLSTNPGINDASTDSTRIYRVNAGSPEITPELLKQKILQTIKPKISRGSKK